MPKSWLGTQRNKADHFRYDMVRFAVATLALSLVGKAAAACEATTETVISTDVTRLSFNGFVPTVTRYVM